MDDTISIKGIHMARWYDLSTTVAESIFNRIAAGSAISNLPQRSRSETLLRPFLLREEAVENLIALEGKTAILEMLGGIAITPTAITHGVLSTSSATPTASDTATALAGSEAYRKTKSEASISGNVLTLKYYFTKLEVSGTFPKWYTVINGTATAGSGVLFSELLTGGWTKATNEGMTVSVDYTFN